MGKEGFFAYPQRDEDNDDPDLENPDIDNWDVGDIETDDSNGETMEAQYPSADGTDQMLSDFGDTNEERQFVAAFGRARHELMEERGSSECRIM